MKAERFYENGTWYDFKPPVEVGDAVFGEVELATGVPYIRNLGELVCLAKLNPASSKDISSFTRVLAAAGSKKFYQELGPAPTADRVIPYLNANLPDAYTVTTTSTKNPVPDNERIIFSRY